MDRRELITVEEAAAELGVHWGSVFRMLKAGRLTRYKRGVGKRIYLDRQEVRALLEVRPSDAEIPAASKLAKKPSRRPRR